MPAEPFTFHAAPHHAIGRAAFTAVRPLLEWLLGAGTLHRIYRDLPRDTARQFDEAVLQALSLSVRCEATDVARVPEHGPLIVAANHPHGALDGLALSALLRRVRPDVRLLANVVLARIPELRPLCFFVDPFDGPLAAARSRAGLRAAQRWLRRGGALVIFPSGEVAPRRCGGDPVDSEWRTTMARMALQAQATILPAFIAGANRPLFYTAGRIHPRLRTALLGRELLAKRGQRVTIRFGDAVDAKLQHGAGGSAEKITGLARHAVEQLRARAATSSLSAIADEIAALPSRARLADSGAFRVFCAEAHAIPHTLQEIGRLRAVTYRAAGEGHGRETDLDQFDDHYLHLFAWDASARKVVGAYRLGPTDQVPAPRGQADLYTRTLFRYGPEFIQQLTPGIELGRSFVRVEYQRHPLALLALWRGIGEYVARNPRYRFLFGPVSISARYSDASRELLAGFLQQNHLDATLARMVEPIYPRPHAPQAAAAVAVPTSVEEANKLAASLDADGKGMPVLLRQYLKLGARLIGFNVDPDFGDVLDALMLVDLATVDSRVLCRYLGQSGAAAFRACHIRRRDVSAAA